MGKKLEFLTGHTIDLDGDLMAIIENLYQEVVVKNELNHSYMDMKNEIDNLIAQMNEEDLRRYLVESIFMNSVSYENQMLEALLKKLADGDEEE